MPPDDRTRYIDLAAALLGLTIPAVCRPGVEANLDLLLRHAAICAAFDHPDEDPAELLRP